MNISIDDEGTLMRWIEGHYYEMIPPEDIYEEETKALPANPNPEHHRTLAIQTTHQEDVEKLPTPTWTATSGDYVWLCYVLTEPPSTLEKPREDKGGRVTRSKGYNTALVVEHNLALAVDGQVTAKIPSPLAFSDLFTDLVHFDWTGKKYEASTLKKMLHSTQLWTTNTHPLFVSEGGKMMTPDQTKARLEAAKAGRARLKAKALKRATEATRLKANGATNAELAEFLQISEGSVPAYMTRAKATLGEAEAA